MDIHNQVAVVTGAAGGIGRALTLELARRGARKVALVDRTECVTTTAQELNDEVGRWHPEDHVQGVGILIGSVSSQGNKGQISYATTKAGLEGAAATLMKEAIFYGVRCALIHPGYTDTPMVQALGEEFIARNI